ncbi:MAG: cytidine deaminase [Saprospiraceae bacterium]
MRKQLFQCPVTVFDKQEELGKDDRALLTLARNTLENAYAPYSGFKVGAAVLLENGEMLSGTNYENASYPLTICAEQSVLAAASSQFPGVAVRALAISVKNVKQVIEHPAAPCGACRQIIYETERKNDTSIRIILQGEKGPVYVIGRGRDLLPLAFDETYL